MWCVHNVLEGSLSSLCSPLSQPNFNAACPVKFKADAVVLEDNFGDSMQVPSSSLSPSAASQGSAQAA